MVVPGVKQLATKELCIKQLPPKELCIVQIMEMQVIDRQSTQQRKRKDSKSEKKCVTCSGK